MPKRRRENRIARLTTNVVIDGGGAPSPVTIPSGRGPSTRVRNANMRKARIENVVVIGRSDEVIRGIPRAGDPAGVPPPTSCDDVDDVPLEVTAALSSSCQSDSVFSDAWTDESIEHGLGDWGLDFD